MDAWSSIIMVVNILLLIAGWLLFQQAKSDLTARAAQVPVLGEVKALQKSIADLLEQLKLESAQTSAQLEARCLEARDLLVALDRRLGDLQVPKPASRATRRRGASAERSDIRASQSGTDSYGPAVEPDVKPALPDNSFRYQEVYTLADEGLAASTIAQRSGISEGEIDLILSLRQRVS